MAGSIMKIEVGYEFIYSFPQADSDDPDDQCPLLAGIGYRDHRTI